MCIRDRFEKKSILVLLTGSSTWESFKINSRQYEALNFLIGVSNIADLLSPYYQVSPTCCVVPGSNPSEHLYTQLANRFAHFLGQCKNTKQCDYSYQQS